MLNTDFSGKGRASSYSSTYRCTRIIRRNTSRRLREMSLPTLEAHQEGVATRRGRYNSLPWVEWGGPDTSSTIEDGL